MRFFQVHTSYRDRAGEDVVVDTEAELFRAAGHEVRRDASGHRLHFAGLIAGALLDLEHDVVFVTSRGAPATASCHEFVAPMTSSVSAATIEVKERLESTRLALARSRWLADALRRMGPRASTSPTATAFLRLLR